MRASDFVAEYSAQGRVGTSGPIKLGNLYKDSLPVVKTPISHLYEVRIDNNSKDYPEYYFYNKDTGACVGQFALDTLSDAADNARAIVKPGVMIVNPHITLAPEVQGKGLGLLIYRTFLSDGNRVFATYGHSKGAGALWNKVATGDIIGVLYDAETDKVVKDGSRESQRAVRVLGHKNKFSTEIQLQEGWKDWVAGGAMALGALGAQAGDIVTQIANPGDTVYKIARDNGVDPKVIMKLNGFNNQTKLTPGQEVKVPDVYKATPTKSAITKGVEKAQPKPVTKAAPKAAPANTVTPITGTKAEQILMNTAMRSGITGTELAAFMAQMAHESHDFKSMVEYGGSLDFRKYDPKYAPKKAKQLGNKYVGDGNKFKGRGFVQITGRYNYGIAGKAIGVDLIKNPTLAENPAIAAKIAVWYWKHRVQPNVTDFNDVEAVTKPINPGMRGLEDRKENFADYITAMASPDTDKKV
jgi:predicted chitinase